MEEMEIEGKIKCFKCGYYHYAGELCPEETNSMCLICNGRGYTVNTKIANYAKLGWFPKGCEFNPCSCVVKSGKKKRLKTILIWLIKFRKNSKKADDS